MKKVFVSYTRRDEYIDNFLLSKINNLISSAHSTYIDVLHNDSIDKQKRVEAELASSDIMILLKSCSIDSSNWVKREIKIAHRYSIPISTIKIDKNSTYKQIEASICNTLKFNNKANRVARGFSPPAPTTPCMRVRTGRFVNRSKTKSSHLLMRVALASSNT